MPFGKARDSTRSSAMSGPVSGNSRVPWPTTTGTMSRFTSSTRSFSSSPHDDVLTVHLKTRVSWDNDEVRALFEWYGNGDVAWSFPGSDGESRSTQASADFMRRHYRNMAAKEEP